MDLIRTIILDPSRVAAWNLTIFREGRDVTNELREIRLAREEGVKGVYILYINASGKEVDDLFYDSLEQALEHVESEFGDIDDDGAI